MNVECDDENVQREIRTMFPRNPRTDGCLAMFSPLLKITVQMILHLFF